MARARTRSFAGLAVDRIRQNHGLRLLTAVVMITFVVVVYAVVVIGGGAILGRTTPSLWLSVLATAIVALAFEPLRSAVKSALAKALHRDRMTPYQVLARFPATVTGSFPAGELPLRMAKVLAEGTGTARAEVWLAVHGQLELAASWPPNDSPADLPAGSSAMGVSACAATATPPTFGPDRPEGVPGIVVEGLRHSIAVRERRELLGALTVVAFDGQRLTPVEERLFAGLAAQSGLMLRVAGLRTELEQQLARLQHRTAELRRARRDLVTRQDAERQRLERNIHDGAQQEVIALLVNLRLAQTLLTRAPERGVRLLAEQSAAARDTIATLTALSRGLYPRLLTDAGPMQALRAAVASGPIPVEFAAAGVARRCSTAVAAAVYFCCLEAVQNATKHSGATTIKIDIRWHAAQLEFAVTDNGRGFDVLAASSGGLANIRDRVESVHGSVSITSEPGRGSTVRAVVPLETEPAPVGDAALASAERDAASAPAVGG